MGRETALMATVRNRDKSIKFRRLESYHHFHDVLVQRELSVPNYFFNLVSFYFKLNLIKHYFFAFLHKKSFPFRGASFHIKIYGRHRSVRSNRSNFDKFLPMMFLR
mmetsp:Transcript_3528/g.8632  ORF Transcript_3528/g.8632 Transcript_3528/m.8632 type:complete len:106 (-) Transcript_3528:186-503(-)